MRKVNVAPAGSADDLNGSGGRLVTADGKTLPLRGATLRADAKGGVARVVLEQRFENVYDEPLHVTYLMPLPEDGAVSGYAFTLGARRVVGEVDKKKVARERFERALASGQTAGLVEQERSSLFTQELGNVPPRTTIVAELTIDQRLTWLDEGAWEWRFPTVAGPRYVGAATRVEDAARTEVAVADAPLPVRLALALAIRDALPEGARPEAPMHKLHVVAMPGRTEVGLSDEGGVRLDRDMVVRWRASAPRVGLSIDTGRPARGVAAEAAYGLVSIVPPAAGSDAARARRRDLILLLDTSGSMGGEPLEQSRRVCLALIDTLGDDDHLEMIEFSTAARRWKSRAVPAVADNKRAARDWLKKLSAGGGTEMVHGVLEALTPLSGEAQRQVVLLTDGYIGFETEVVRAICDKLPAGSRLHVVGVGSAVNRSLTGPSARAGRGVEIVVAPGEDPERPVRRLLARTSAPIVTDVEIEGEALLGRAPSRLPDLYAGAPAVCAVRLRPEGGALRVRGRTAEGSWEERVHVAACDAGQGNAAAAALFARESVEDLELRRVAGGEAGELDPAIERLGLDFQIATRLTTWVAISQEITVDPSAPTRREVVPQELPHGVSAEGLGLRRAGAPAPFATTMQPMVMSAAPMMMPMGAPPPSPAPGGMPPSARKAASPIGSAIGAAASGMARLFKGRGAQRDEEREDTGAGAGAPPAEAPEPADVGESFADEAAPIDDAKLEAELERVGQMLPKPKPAKKEEAADKRASEKAKADQPAPPARPAPRRRLRARLRLLQGRELVLEITVDGAMFDWRAPGAVQVRLDDGRLVDAKLDVVRSTRAGQYAVGQVLRVVLSLAAEPGAATPTLASFDGVDLEIHAA